MGISPNGPFKVQFELGRFWSENDELRAQCMDNLNPTWWSIANTDSDAATKAIFAAHAERVRSQFVSDHLAQSMESSPVGLQVIAVMVIGIAAVALLRLCTLRDKKMTGIVRNADGNVY